MELLRRLARGRAELVPEKPAQPVVHEESLGGVAAGRHDLHEPPIAALSKRRRLDERLRRPLARAELRAASAEPGGCDTLESAKAEILETSPLRRDPRRLVTGEERARRDGQCPGEGARRELINARCRAP